MKTRSFNLLRLFWMSSLVSLAVILTLTYFGIRYIYHQNVIEIAERQSISVSQALYMQERALLTSGDGAGATSLDVAGQDFERLDRRMRDYLAPFNITKIKAFNESGKIVYSTDGAIVGNTSTGNRKLARALRGEVVAEMETKERVNDLSEETRFDVDVVETYLPVTNDDGEIIGTFEVYLDMTPFRERMYGTVHSSVLVIAAILLVTFGVQFGIMRKGTSELDRYEVKLQVMAATDELTGLANRRFVLDRAEQEFARLKRSESSQKASGSLGCIMIDIDSFKEINDQHGHAAGDAVLRELGVRLRPMVRQYDILGRFGGEEFVVMTPQTDIEQARMIAERIRHGIRDQSFSYEEHHFTVTASLGVSCTQQEDRSMEQTIKRADEKLYEAKRAGRDRVVS